MAYWVDYTLGCLRDSYLPDLKGARIYESFVDIFKDYYESREVSTGLSHNQDIIGALINAWSEFQRRFIGPYEESKLNLNGDVLD